MKMTTGENDKYAIGNKQKPETNSLFSTNRNYA